jgi:hypothetical protein
MGCGSAVSLENTSIKRFWEVLNINNMTATSIIEYISQLKNKNNLKNIIKHKDIFEEVIINHFISISNVKSPCQTQMFRDLHSSIKRNKENKEKMIISLLFCLLILSKDFKFQKEAEQEKVLVDFFIEIGNLTKNKREYIIENTKGQFYIRLFDLLYFISFYVNLISLYSLKYISLLTDDKSSFISIYNNYFSLENQNMIIMECFNEIIIDMNSKNNNFNSSNDIEFNGLTLFNEIQYIQKSMINAESKQISSNIFINPDEEINNSDESHGSKLFKETDCWISLKSFIRKVIYLLKEPSEVREKLKRNHKLAT